MHVFQGALHKLNESVCWNIFFVSIRYLLRRKMHFDDGNADVLERDIYIYYVLWRKDISICLKHAPYIASKIYDSLLLQKMLCFLTSVCAHPFETGEKHIYIFAWFCMNLHVYAIISMISMIHGHSINVNAAGDLVNILSLIVPMLSIWRRPCKICSGLRKSNIKAEALSHDGKSAFQTGQTLHQNVF